MNEWYWVLLFRFQHGPARYQDEYAKLRSWTYTSLDLYRVPIHTHLLLFPLLQYNTILFSPPQLSVCVCSMSCSVFFTLYLFTVSWISLLRVIFKKVPFASFSHICATKCQFWNLHDYCGCYQLGHSSVASEKTMRWCTYEIYRSWKEFFLPLIWRSFLLLQ